MKILIAVATLLADQASAELSCGLTDVTCDTNCAVTSVQFHVDKSQFVDAQDPADPPRRQVTQVTMGARMFNAQAIMMDGGILGFHEDAGEIGSALMIVQADGSARLLLQPENQTLTGGCTTTN